MNDSLRAGVQPKLEANAPFWLRPLLIVWVLVAPGFIVSLLLAVTQGATLLDCVPYWNDEIAHWRQAATFAHAGFGGGYCTVNERPARHGHFGPHGPGYATLYGSIGWLVGWQENSAPLINVGLLLAAASAWLWTCPLSTTRLAVVALLASTFWPMLLMLPQTMHETLNFALAFVLAAVIQRYLALDSLRPKALAGVFAAVMTASIFRVTWSLLLIPCVLVGFRRASWRGKLLGTALALAGIAVAVFATFEWCAPYPNYLSRLAHAAHESPRLAMSMAWAKTTDNLGAFFFQRESNLLEVMIDFEVLAVILVGFAGAFAARRRQEPASRSSALAFAGLNLILIVVAVVLVYDVADWRAFRVLSPHLLLSLLLLAANARCRWIIDVVVVNTLFLLPFIHQFALSNEPRFREDKAEAAEMERVLRTHIAYDSAASGWDNTLLVPADAVRFPLLRIPRGVNMSVVFQYEALSLPLRSRYLLLRPADLEVLHNRVRLRHLAETSLGGLYLNLDRAPNLGDAGP